MKCIKSLLTACLMLCVAAVSAHDFEVDGIYYNITDATNKTVAVTYSGSFSTSVDNEYTGSVVIPESVSYNGKVYCVTSIGVYAFGDCSGLTSIEIPNSVTSIGGAAFEGCFGLTSIVIGNSVTSIEDCAFDGCSGLTSVTIPNSVTSIGYCAFYNCSGLTSIEIPNSVTSIGDYAFYNCSGLTSIEIPNSVTSIGEEAFYGTAWYNNQPDGIVYAGMVLYAYKGSMPENTSVIVKEGTISIKDEAFSGCSGLTSIEIPNSVTSIGNSAFEGTAWYNNQPDGVVYAGNVLYKYKGTMPPNTSVLVKDGTLGIATSAFSGCSGLTSVTIPNSVTSIGNYAFSRCSGLTSIIIPNSVVRIGYRAFSYCSRLKEVHINDLSAWCNISFGYDANPLSDAENLYLNGELVTDLVIPDNVKEIKDYAFKDCSGLTSVTIPNSVTSIGESAFQGCSGLTSITIPNSVISIGESAFRDCTGLTSIEIPNSVTSIGYFAFFGCSGLTSIEIPGCVTSIGSSAFRDCSGLTSITIPNSVTSIGDYAFCDCWGLTSVVIGNSVTSIGESAFQGCSGLKTVVNLSRLTLSAGSTGCGYVAYYADKVINAHNGSIEGDFVFGKPDGASTLVAYLGSEIELVLPVDYGGENYVIGDDVFSHCSELENLTIPCRVTNIGNYAFNGCTSLKELCIEDGEEALVLGCNDAGKGLFYDCPLEILYVGRTLSYEKDSLSGYSPFYGIETLASVGIGTSDLDENLFDGCLNINNVGFNTEVAPSIFANHAKVTDVTLSGRVKLVSDGAFAGMDKLTNVVLETPVPPAISSAAFDNLHYKLLYVYLLDGCTPIYQASEIWKNFLDIQEFIPDGSGVCEAANVWRNYWDIPEYSIPEGEIEESVLADVPQLERVSDGVRLPNAKGKRITVYTFSGSLIKNVSGYSGETIALDKGTYIIVADNDAMKVVL